jgi:hypothetical protein
VLFRSLLSIFLVGVQYAFFDLLPLGFMDGGDLWRWKRGVWLALYGGVLFAFCHLFLNPSASDVQALQRNGVQVLGALMALWGGATLALWLAFPFRLRQRR